MQDREEIITIVMETDQGFNVYTGIDAKEIDRIGIPDEPDLFTPDLYNAVKFADEYIQEHHAPKIPGIVFMLRKETKKIIDCVNPKPALAELCINLAEGQAVISPDGTVEFHDTGLNISLLNLKFVVQEAEAYLKYRNERADAQTKAH